MARANRTVLSRPGVTEPGTRPQGKETGRGLWRRLLVLVVCCQPILGAGALAAAEADVPIAFDIPGQSLAQALEIYGDVTGWEVLYNSTLAAGRRSGAVRGRFTPETALQILLAGTGLVARYTDVTSFVLVSPPPVVGVRTPPDTTDDALSARRLDYYALIQESLKDALCRTSDARPGGYRIAARLWIDPVGDVVRSQRLGSTGRTATDGRIERTLRSLKIGAPPPAGFAQPVTILVVPQAPEVTGSCDSDPGRSIKAGP